MKKTLITLLGVCAMTLTACADKEASSAIKGEAIQKLEGTSWQLVGAAKTGDCENLPPLMSFMADNKVGGNLGCNLFSTSYKIDGKKFTFAEAAVTRRMCDPDSMKTEERLLKMLKDARFATQDPKGIMFWNEKGELLAQYEPEVPGTCK